uniref:Putative transposase n=1 Tax=Ixodes ricinus TaxID=34613 RepID=A0A6B0V389_IXORI
MKVQFAAQVFSDTLSVSLATLLYLSELPLEAQATCDLLEHMDQLFDSLNSSPLECSELTMRFALSSSSGDINFLREKSSSIPKWQFLPPGRPHRVRGCHITINAVFLLWEDLSGNFDFDHLLTRRLNQDPLENLFGMVRQQHGCNETPNSYQFVAGLKHILLERYFSFPVDETVRQALPHCWWNRGTFRCRLQPATMSEPLPAIKTDEFDLPDE